MLEKGLVQIYTGDGKGKTTAAFGLALRVAGQGNKVGLRILPTQDGAYVIVGSTDEYGRGFETVLIKIKDAGSGM